jgi:hypothetical protein
LQRVVTSTIVAFVLLVPAAWAKGNPPTVPSGSGVSQYVETLPTATGAAQSSNASTPNRSQGAGSARAAADAGGGGSDGTVLIVVAVAGALVCACAGGAVWRRRLRSG